MRGVVRFTISQAVFFNLIFVLLIVVGAFATLRLPVERYPLINFGKVFISTYYRGASPEEVESLITRKIEDAIEDLEDVEFIRSTSYRERSSVLVKFYDDTDYENLYKELRFRVMNVQKELPEDADPPGFVNIKTSDWLPVVSVNLAGDKSNRALTLMAEEMKSPLALIPGVQEVKLQGEYTREFHVFLDPERMARYGVTFEDVSNALRLANVSIPSGDFSDGAGEFVVKVDEKFRTREQVVNAIVRRDADGAFLRVKDVISRAFLSYRDPFVITSVNGRRGVTLQVVKTEQGNALDIKSAVVDLVEEFKPLFAKEGVEIVLTQDSTVYIEDAMDTLGWNLIVGVLLVSLIIWYFMGFRNACLTTVGIPFSFLTTMILMKLTGNSLNEITLFSFVLVSGIVVDDAIVVVENIYRHVQEGRNVLDAIVDGAAEVAFPVISATSTTAAAFLPMLIMTGSTGEFFALIPKAVVFALIASVFECLFILPLHYLDWGPRLKTGVRSVRVEKDNLAMKVSSWCTEKIMAVTLRFRISSLLLVLVLFIVSAGVLAVSAMGIKPLIPIQFFPDDYNLYYVNVEGPSSAPVGTLDKRLKDISRFILADGPGMAKNAIGFAGFYVTEDYQQVFGNNYGNVVVTLPARDDRTFSDPFSYLDEMRARIKEQFENGAWKIKVRAEKGGPPTGKDVNVRVLGVDPEAVSALARDMMRFMQENTDFGPYLVDLDDDVGQPNRIFRFRVREERAAEYGLNPTSVANLAASVLDGRYLGKFRLPDDDVDFKLAVAPEYLTGPERALRIPLVEHASGPLRLADLTEAETYTEPNNLKRYNGKRSITLEANLEKGAPAQASVPAIVHAVQEYYKTVREKFLGATVEFGGEFESTQRSYASLTYAFLIAVLLMYLILANQFKSYLQPLIILSAVVFSLIGVVVGKLVTQTLFTVNSFIAIVGVTGVVVNDSLVLVDFINRLYRQGYTRRQALEEGIRIRLRPIMLTTLTTTLGLLPMAVGFPQYSLVWGSMASTFVTGLCTATALTLFIVPVEWDLLMGFMERRQRRRDKKDKHDAGETAHPVQPEF